MRLSRYSLLLPALATVALPPNAAAQSTEFLDALLADVERLESRSNTERGDVLQDMLRELGIAFETQQFEISPRPNYPRTEGANIVVTIGEGPETIAIGGHYDAAWLPNGELSPGAVDNAASAVILTRLADALDDQDRAHRIRIVLFDMEEIGLIGSRDFIERYANDPIVAGINLDVNGYGDTLLYPEPPGAPSNSVLTATEAVCATGDFSCRSFAQYPASDHLSFRQAGIPNVSFAILPRAEIDILHAALNPAPGEPAVGAPPRVFSIIHTENDVSALIEPKAMATTFRAVLALIEELSPAVE